MFRVVDSSFESTDVSREFGVGIVGGSAGITGCKYCEGGN